MRKQDSRWEECKNLLLKGLEQLTENEPHEDIFFLSGQIYERTVEIINKRISEEYGEGAELDWGGGLYFIRTPLPAQSQEPFYGPHSKRTKTTMAVPGKNDFREMIRELTRERKIHSVYVYGYCNAYRALPKKESP